jgi:hypothetical protein
MSTVGSKEKLTVTKKRAIGRPKKIGEARRYSQKENDEALSPKMASKPPKLNQSTKYDTSVEIKHQKKKPKGSSKKKGSLTELMRYVNLAKR